MGIFFGTDGIRGVVNDELTHGLAHKCGNALASTKEKANILIGGDTRLSRTYLTSAFACGAMAAGANVVDVGICTTPCIAYLTKTLGFDFGVMISASHNPAKYNGIKIFGSDGFKLGDEKEALLERRFVNEVILPHNKIGNYSQCFGLINKYIDYLTSCSNVRFDGMKIVLDSSNGAAYKIAPKVFKKLGATVIKINCFNNGNEINNNCGSLFPEKLASQVILHKADVGFAFDGDADRIIACDENGNVVDGDKIIFLLSKYFKSKNKLNFNTVVGTRHTNIGIEKALNKCGIKLERTDIGDKYVIAKMNEQNLSLGGEKSGHIIIKENSTTGDGVLTGVKICEVLNSTHKKMSDVCQAKLYPQCNIDIVVKDKMRIINSEKLSKVINEEEIKLGENSRIMVRVSGTEPKIRIMTECKNFKKAKESAVVIEQTIKEIGEMK